MNHAMRYAHPFAVTENSGNFVSPKNNFVIALERLSSALRTSKSKGETERWINTSIGARPINELDQAVHNASDGISLVQTAVKALKDIQDHLQHIHSLSVQSVMRNSAEERAEFNREIQQHLAHIDYLASHTHFKDQHLLTGKFGTAHFQVGSAVDEVIPVNLGTSMRINQLGQIPINRGNAVTANALSAGGVSIAVGGKQAVTLGTSIAGLGAGQTADSAYAKAQAINQLSIAGLHVTASTQVRASFSSILAAPGNTYALKLNGVAIFHDHDLQHQGHLTGERVARQINLYSSQTGVSAIFMDDTSQMILTAADGRNIAIKQTLGGQSTGGFADAVAGQSSGDLIHRGILYFNANENISFSGNYWDLGVAQPTLAKDEKTLIAVNVLTEANASNAILRIQSALFTVGNLLGNLEAIQSHFYSIIHNFEAVSQNLPTSQNRIQTAETALEMASMIRSQFAQSPPMSLLVQANATPQTVLKLLS